MSLCPLLCTGCSPSTSGEEASVLSFSKAGTRLSWKASQIRTGTELPKITSDPSGYGTSLLHASLPSTLSSCSGRKRLTGGTQPSLTIHQKKCFICTRMDKHLSLANTGAVTSPGHAGSVGSTRAMNRVRHNKSSQQHFCALGFLWSVLKWCTFSNRAVLSWKGCNLGRQLLSYEPTENLLLKMPWSSWKSSLQHGSKALKSHTANTAFLLPACLHLTEV